jgi:hypothetical protein
LAFRQLLPAPVCKHLPAICLVAAALASLGSVGYSAELDPETAASLRELRQQNQLLQEQLKRQQQFIDDLTRKVSALESTSPERKSAEVPSLEPARESWRSAIDSALGKVHLSGEGGIGFFESQSHGQSPNSEFRVDEAKLFVEAPIWGEVYFFSELNLFQREDPEFNIRPGELYLDFENLSRFWKQDGQLNLRLGRIDIPFGEEYLTRDAIDNPLISHSIMDFWGVDEGVELYGELKKFQYVIAVQNGGHNAFRDFTGDKAVTVRLGYNPRPWLHLSVSGMRTGSLDARSDGVSELWLGSGLVYSLGSTNTTRFEANVLQGDLQLTFPRTTFKASGGVLEYRDNDPQADNERHVVYYSLEATQQLYRGLYAAARWSQAFAPGGFPLIGNGNVGNYFMTPTRDLSLLSLGLGYRWSKQLVVKAEYAHGFGREMSGDARSHEDLIAAMAAFAF